MLFDRVDVLIAWLDSHDDDLDLEEDDHSGDPLELNGEAPSDDGRGVLPQRPFYGVNQDAAPLNYAEAHSAFLAAEGGFDRNSNGGWRISA